MNATGTGDTATATPTVISFTPGAGANYLVLRFATQYNALVANVVGVACVPTSGPTVNLSELGTILDATNNTRLGLWGGGAIVATMAYTVTVTYTGANVNASLGLSAYAGVGGVQAGSFASAQGTGTAASVTIAAGSGALVLDCAAGLATPTITPGAGQTAERAVQYDGDSRVGIRGSYQAGTGSVTMTATVTGTRWQMVGVALIP